MRDTISTLALVVVGVIGTFVLLTLPVLVGGMVDQFGWGDREVGWLASADMLGSAVASLLALTFIARIDWKRTTYTAIAFAIAGNIVCIYADSFASLMAIRMATGFSNGFILAIVFAGLCHSSNPDRYFGAYVFTQLSLQALLLAGLPALLGAYGMPGVYVLLAAASGISALLVTLFPDNSLRRSPSDRSDIGTTPASGPATASLPAWAIVALAAQAIYFLAPAAIWGYFEPIGAAFALDIAQIGRALGLASIAGIVGSAAVVIIGVRLDRILSMAFGTIISMIAVLILIDGSGFSRYLIAASLFSFAWNYTFPYQMGVLALFDRSGSVAVLSLVVQLTGLAFGPMLASFLLFGEGYDVILWTCIACYIGSFWMFYFAHRNRANSAVAFDEA